MKKAQASIVIAIILLVIIMMIVIVAVTILLINPNFLFNQEKNLQNQTQVIIIKSPENSPAQPTCNYPYFYTGINCCLDQNANRICDSDEPKKQENTCSYPYIKDGDSCCLDDDEDHVCDMYEYTNHHDEDNKKNNNDYGYLNSPFELFDVNKGNTTIWMRISNTGSYDYIIKKINVEGCDLLSPNQAIYEDKRLDFTVNCVNGTSQDKAITIEYTKSSDDSIKTSTGKIKG